MCDYYNLDQNTILIVDDEEKVINSIIRLLRKEPYTILKAIDGKKGLEIMHENKVDIVLVDQSMPEMTGLEFLKVVKYVKQITKYFEYIRLNGPVSKNRRILSIFKSYIR